jgi:hypothetical protein
MLKRNSQPEPNRHADWLKALVCNPRLPGKLQRMAGRGQKERIYKGLRDS